LFGFLKRKLGDVVKKFSKEVEDESEVIEVVDELKSDEVVAQDSKDVKKKGVVKDSSNVKSKKKVSKPIVEKDVVKEKVEEDVVEEVSESADSIDESVQEKSVEEIKSDDVVEKEVVDVESSKKGFFSKFKETFTKIKLSDEKFEELFWDLEVALLENNVALEVIQKIKDDLKNDLTQDKISRKNVQDTILDSLRNSIKEVLSVEKIDFLKKVNSKKPFVIAVIGVNGSGKTTTIAKLCYYLKKNNKSLVLAAADTFRAAAIQQIEHHAQNLDVKLIKHDYNSDPSAVAFDAIRHAEAKNLDVVVIDTAGRLHSNDNLMNELKKLVRVNKPDLKLFVGESITGNDCVEQARKYDEIIGIDAIVLSKADIDEKGGAALSISYVTKKPVLFIGTGQNYEDLEIYDEQKILSNLGI